MFSSEFLYLHWYINSDRLIVVVVVVVVVILQLHPFIVWLLKPEVESNFIKGAKINFTEFRVYSCSEPGGIIRNQTSVEEISCKGINFYDALFLVFFFFFFCFFLGGFQSDMDPWHSSCRDRYFCETK